MDLQETLRLLAEGELEWWPEDIVDFLPYAVKLIESDQTAFKYDLFSETIWMVNLLISFQKCDIRPTWAEVNMANIALQSEVHKGSIATGYTDYGGR